MKNAALLLPSLLLVACGSSDTPDGPTSRPAGADAGASAEVVAQRDLAAALFAEDKEREAYEVLLPLADVEVPAIFDLNALGVCAFEAGDKATARTWFERALEVAPGHPAPLYNLGNLDVEALEFDAALARFEAAVAGAADDLPTRLALAICYQELDLLDEADALFGELQGVGLEFSGSWYMTILYRHQQVLRWLDRVDEADELLAEFERLEARGVTVPAADDLRRGNFGNLLPPDPLAAGTALPLDLPPFGPAAPLFGEALAGFPVTGLVQASATATWALGEEVRDEGAAEARRLPDRIDPGGWVAWGAAGLRLVDAAGAVTEVTADPVDRALPLDLEDDGDLDLLTVTGSVLSLWLQADGAFTGRELTDLGAAPRDATLWDYDHEGDLDLALVGPFGLVILRNDGAEFPEGSFTDVTAEAGLDGEELQRVADWVVAEDFDTDQDVDLLWGGADGAHLADNLRAGAFAAVDERVAGLPIGREPLVSDVDRDGRPDLVFADGSWFAARVDGSYAAHRDGPAGRPLVVVGDLDHNGDRDALAIGEDGNPAVWLGLATVTALDLPAFDAVGGLADADGDGVDDLVLVREGRAEVHAGTPTDARSFPLVLEGVKDNRAGRGAIVELRIGTAYQRWYWTGERATVGLGAEDEALVLRITWPNGVVQSIARHPAGAPLVVKQKEGLIGSCPFLYTWNGEEYVFITDVLGITPLGLPMGPGMFVPPDHDEYVLVTGEQLRPREDEDGLWYDLQFTEELREVTYLDEARLIVVDHPLGTEIYPDERFCFPPFPGGHTHIAEELHGPLSMREVDLATGSAEGGRDWADEVAAIDGDYAHPFEHFRGRFQGLAKPHVVELAFDPEAVADAERLRLLMTGWFYWTDASVNMAAARTPGVDFVPPIFSVPDADSPTGWRELGPPFGFPAGKTKTMVVDLTDQLDPADPRLRVFCTLRLYWDAIRLATCGDDAPMITHELPVHSSELYERGFSKPVRLFGDHELEWFDWNELETEPRWNQHPGRYTKFGDVTPLLHEPEDRFVILGAGDALHLRFDASAVPPVPEGHRRDFLVFLDGWAKDRDPNAIDVEFVEPMPFHGMSGFPYGPDEAFPDTPEHRAWKAEWNTRGARRWIEPLAPKR